MTAQPNTVAQEQNPEGLTPSVEDTQPTLFIFEEEQEAKKLPQRMRHNPAFAETVSAEVAAQICTAVKQSLQQGRFFFVDPTIPREDRKVWMEVLEGSAAQPTLVKVYLTIRPRHSHHDGGYARPSQRKQIGRGQKKTGSNEGDAVNPRDIRKDPVKPTPVLVFLDWTEDGRVKATVTRNLSRYTRYTRKLRIDCVDCDDM